MTANKRTAFPSRVLKKLLSVSDSVYCGRNDYKTVVMTRMLYTKDMNSVLAAIWKKEKEKPAGRFTRLFAENLRYIRSEHRCTQQKVAQDLDIPTSTYANWEQGRREPSITDIFRLLLYFDIDANELFFADETNL